MKKVCIVISFFVSWGYSSAQDIDEMLEVLFFHQKVFNSVFFEYEGLGEKPFVLEKGVYAFIYPDSVFEEYYTGLLDTLSLTWATERKLFTRTYIVRPEGVIYIKSNVRSDPNMKLYMMFERIQMNEGNAYVDFYTSCSRIDDSNGRVTFVKAFLRKKGEKWKVRKLKVSYKRGCK